MTEPCLLLLVSLAMQASCEVFDLDDSVPVLRSRGQAVALSAGWDAFVVADSSCVRVNARGVYAKPSHWTPRKLGGIWSTNHCLPGASAGLCETSNGAVFPGSIPRYNASNAWGGLRCSRASDGRLMDPSYGYDVSACDVLDGGGDVVLCGRSLGFARTSVADWVYWTLCLLAVFVVRSLSYLVASRVRPGSLAPESRPHDVWTVLACVAILILALAPEGDAGFVTVEETLFFVWTCLYVGCYIMVFVICQFFGLGKSDPPIYNLIAASVQVIACRLYLGAETPYNPVIIWAIATRALVKLRAPVTEAWLVNFVTTFVDSLSLTLMCVLGFEYNKLYLVALGTLALSVSDALSLER